MNIANNSSKKKQTPSKTKALCVRVRPQYKEILKNLSDNSQKNLFFKISQGELVEMGIFLLNKMKAEDIKKIIFKMQ